MPNFPNALISVLAAAAVIVATAQYIQSRQLRQTLSDSDIRQAELQQHIERLESNMQSAGVQLQNLANIAQAANERAAGCDQTD